MSSSSNNNNNSYIDASIITPEMERLYKERMKRTFDHDGLVERFWGGKERLSAKRKIYQLVERDAIMNPNRPYDMSLEQVRESTMAKVRRGLEIRRMLGSSSSSSSTHIGDEGLLVRVFDEVMDEFDATMYMRCYVHFTLFGETIWAQGTAEQYQAWAKKVREMSVIGCFAMTELGHSSFLRGLETVADYDRERSEFVVNSPTLTSTKWWIGMAGHTATHTVALAKCRINGEVKGLNWFIVPLRDPRSGRLLPGVSAGGIGAKFGKHGVDNGWIQFSQVRVPFSNMLSRWASIDEKTGEYSSPKNPAIVYATLVGERIWAVEGITNGVAQAVTIGARYGVLRLQGNKNQQIIDYQSHQYALMPSLATVYALNSVVRMLRPSWSEAQLLGRNESTIDQFLQELPDFHAIAAGLKASFGWWTMDALEQARRTTGGHGYSAYNKLGPMIAGAAVGTTGGGDNIVLAQQCARYLVRTWQKLVAGGDSVFVGHSARYLRDIASSPDAIKTHIVDAKWAVHTPKDLESADRLLEASRWLAGFCIHNGAEALQEAMMDGKLSLSEAWNDNMMKLVRATDKHCFHFVLSTFISWSKQTSDKGQVEVLAQLWQLFALRTIERSLDVFYEGGYMTPKQGKMVRTRVKQLCAAVRQQAIPLTDVFDYPDFVLNAQIAPKDGDLYRKYFEYVKQSPDGYSAAKYWNKEVAPLVNPDHYHRYEKPLFSSSL